VAAPRHTWAPCQLQPLTLPLPAGRALLPTLADALAAQAPGVHSAVLRLQGGSFFPFAWVLPALAPTPEHAVYFSARHEATAPVQLIEATVSFGRRDGRPWLHTHARWTDADGQPHCGHVLPEDAVISTPLSAQAWVLQGAGFEVLPDEETRFALFKPQATGAAPTGRALALRLAPNADVCCAIEQLCAAQGITSARVRGGVGSTVGAVFDDGRVVQPFVTESLIRHGRMRPGPDGTPVAEIDVAMVDHQGGLHQGRLARGQNPVLVTFELVLEPDDLVAATRVG